RSPPLPGPVLVMKKVIVACCASRAAGTPSDTSVSAASMNTFTVLFMAYLPVNPFAYACPLASARDTCAVGASIARGQRGPCPLPSRPIALLRKAVEQSVAAGGTQVVRAAAPGHMRGVPRLRIHMVLEAPLVRVADHGAAKGAARPIVAGQVEVTGKGP